MTLAFHAYANNCRILNSGLELDISNERVMYQFAFKRWKQHQLLSDVTACRQNKEYDERLFCGRNRPKIAWGLSSLFMKVLAPGHRRRRFSVKILWAAETITSTICWSFLFIIILPLLKSNSTIKAIVSGSFSAKFGLQTYKIRKYAIAISIFCCIVTQLDSRLNDDLSKIKKLVE